MTRKKVRLTATSISGQKLSMDVYKALIGTIYKALRNDDRIFDILIEGMTYQDYVRQYGGLVVPA